MTDTLSFQILNTIDGALHYIVLDPDDRIIAGSSDVPAKLASLVTACRKNMAAISRTGFEYAVFERKNSKDIFIFNIGNTCIGVIKQRYADHEGFIGDVKKTLNQIRG